MNRSKLLGIIALLVLTLAIATTGCCPVVSMLEAEEEGGSSAESRAGGESAPDLETFLDSDSKTGEYTAHTQWADGDSLDQTGEFWVDGRLFRYDIYEDERLVRSVMSPDGKTAYFAYHDEQVCKPSVASVDYYLMQYFKPEGQGVEDGIDEETGATRVVYTVQKTDTMEGSSNPWYSEDITYLVTDDEVVGLISRGTVPEDDGSIGALDVSREVWSNVQAGISIPAKTFELPYPVQNAE